MSLKRKDYLLFFQKQFKIFDSKIIEVFQLEILMSKCLTNVTVAEQMSRKNKG